MEYTLRQYFKEYFILLLVKYACEQLPAKQKVPAMAEENPARYGADMDYVIDIDTRRSESSSSGFLEPLPLPPLGAVFPRQ
jgi:hypothetical protein